MLAGFEAVEAIDAAGIVNGGAVAGNLYCLCLTAAFAESAMDTFAIGDARLHEKRANNPNTEPTGQMLLQ